MARFFINRPIVAMVIAVLTVLVGLIALVQLPISLYPEIAPPEILLTARYPGADAVTLEQSVATPIEEQMSGVDKMLYMSSLNQGSAGTTELRVAFDVTTDPEPGPGPDEPPLLSGGLAAAVRRGEPGRHGQEVGQQPAGRLRRCTRPRARTIRSSSLTMRTSMSTIR